MLFIGIFAFAGYKAFFNDKTPNRLPESKVKEIYTAIAGDGKYTINGPRATFIENGIKWTIVGANTPIVNPTVYPKEWPVKGDNFEVLLIPEPITNYKILPFTEKIENAVKSDTISITAAKGEYVPASFVIRSGDNDLKNIMVEVTDLKVEFKDKNGNKKTAIIPKENIDIRGVKCWYQAGVAIDDISHKILVPELLLHDDDLIRVDYDKQVNIVKKFDSIEDAETLQLFMVPKRQNKQIWLTVYIPPATMGGEYNGLIKIFINGVEKKTLKLLIKVLPFELPKPILNYSLYYLSRYSDTYKGRPIVKYKNEQQMYFEFKDMLAHGINNPTVVIDHEELADGTQDLSKLEKVIRIRREVGISNNEPLLYVDWKVTYKENLEKYKQKVKAIVNLAQKNEIKEVFIYGEDERSGGELVGARPLFETVHKAGAKNFVAGWLAGFVKFVPDILDLFIVNGMNGFYAEEPEPRWSVSGPTSKQISEAKKIGRKMWLYNNPQTGLELPAIYRKNFGVRLWLSGMNGACNYAYQEGDPWDDFNSNPLYRSHTMAYPTISGKPIPTLQWEGWREGVDDVRYLTLLIQKKVNEKELKSIISDIDNPYKIRKMIIERLLKND